MSSIIFLDHVACILQEMEFDINPVFPEIVVAGKSVSDTTYLWYSYISLSSLTYNGGHEGRLGL
jgi:hypothetical protein